MALLAVFPLTRSSRSPGTIDELSLPKARLSQDGFLVCAESSYLQSWLHRVTNPLVSLMF
jgi:hypothetical protein